MIGKERDSEKDIFDSGGGARAFENYAVRVVRYKQNTKSPMRNARRNRVAGEANRLRGGERRGGQ